MAQPSPRLIRHQYTSRKFNRLPSVMIVSPASLLPSFYCPCGYSLPCNKCTGLVSTGVASNNQDLDCIVDIHAALSELQFEYTPPNIFMAPSPLRWVNPQAFIPQVVPIGPYHSKRQLSEMKTYKMLAAKATEKGFTDGNTFNTLLDKIKHLLEDVKALYDGEFDKHLDSKLAEILALDASFVIQVFRAWRDCNLDRPVQNFEFIYKNKLPPPVRKSIIQDFLLLENQIPLLLLKEVMKMEGKSEKDIEDDLRGFVSLMAQQVLPPVPLSPEGLTLPADYTVRGDKQHLLDCVYTLFTGERQSDSSTGRSIDTPTASNLSKARIILKPCKRSTGRSIDTPTASNLSKAGIIFKPCKGYAGFGAIDFSNSTLWVPRIRVGDDTEPLFRNLLAYESHFKVDTADVLSYLKFMNSLIDTPEDVLLLVESKIIYKDADVRSDEEVAFLFNGLCTNTAHGSTTRYQEVADDLNKHYEKKYWKMWSEFKCQYLSRPWLVISTLSAVALLVMTFLTTLYTLKLYYLDLRDSVSDAVHMLARERKLIAMV